MPKNLKDICVHMNAQQGVISAEKDFNNQVDRMTCYIDTNQPLSPAFPVIAQRSQEQRGHITNAVT